MQEEFYNIEKGGPKDRAAFFVILGVVKNVSNDIIDLVDFKIEMKNVSY